MAVNCFGSGMAGLPVLAPMHTPPIVVDFRMEGKNVHAHFTHADIFSLHELLNAEALAIRVLGLSVHPHAEPLSAHPSHTQEFSWFFN